MGTRLLVGVLVLVASSATAQVTGGSFGSSDWGDDHDHDHGSSFGSSSWGSSSSSGSSSSGSSWGSSSSSGSSWGSSSSSGSSWGSSSSSGSSDSSWGSSSSPSPFRRDRYDDDHDYHRRSRGPSGDGLGKFLLIAFLLISVVVVVGGSVTVLGVSVLTLFRRRSPFLLDEDDEPIVRYVPPPRQPAPFGIVTLQLGLDASARSDVQRALSTLARTLPIGSAEGRLQALRATLVLLEGHEASVAYESGEVRLDLDKVRARRLFTERTTELRARFRDELVRRVDDAPLRRGSSSVRALPEEGDGFVVVSIVAAARRLASPTQVGFEAAAGALMPLTGEDLVAFEVIWSPAADTDRMSSLELEVLYPELVRVARDVGRVVCACGVGYAAELGRCPSCGRPVAEATRA